jgi:hypothetical protein
MRNVTLSWFCNTKLLTVAFLVGLSGLISPGKVYAAQSTIDDTYVLNNLPVASASLSDQLNALSNLINAADDTANYTVAPLDQTTRESFTRALATAFSSRFTSGNYTAQNISTLSVLMDIVTASSGFPLLDQGSTSAFDAASTLLSIESNIFNYQTTPITSDSTFNGLLTQISTLSTAILRLPRLPDGSYVSLAINPAITNNYLNLILVAFKARNSTASTLRSTQSITNLSNMLTNASASSNRLVGTWGSEIQALRTIVLLEASITAASTSLTALINIANNNMTANVTPLTQELFSGALQRVVQAIITANNTADAVTASSFLRSLKVVPLAARTVTLNGEASTLYSTPQPVNGQNILSQLASANFINSTVPTLINNLKMIALPGIINDLTNPSRVPPATIDDIIGVLVPPPAGPLDATTQANIFALLQKLYTNRWTEINSGSLDPAEYLTKLLNLFTTWSTAQNANRGRNPVDGSSTLLQTAQILQMTSPTTGNPPLGWIPTIKNELATIKTLQDLGINTGPGALGGGLGGTGGAGSGGTGGLGGGLGGGSGTIDPTKLGLIDPGAIGNFPPNVLNQIFAGLQSLYNSFYVPPRALGQGDLAGLQNLLNLLNKWNGKFPASIVDSSGTSANSTIAAWIPQVQASIDAINAAAERQKLINNINNIINNGGDPSAALTNLFNTLTPPVDAATQQNIFALLQKVYNGRLLPKPTLAKLQSVQNIIQPWTSARGQTLLTGSDSSTGRPYQTILQGWLAQITAEINAISLTGQIATASATGNVTAQATALQSIIPSSANLNIAPLAGYDVAGTLMTALAKLFNGRLQTVPFLTSLQTLLQSALTVQNGFTQGSLLNPTQQAQINAWLSQLTKEITTQQALQDAAQAEQSLIALIKKATADSTTNYPLALNQTGPTSYNNTDLTESILAIATASRYSANIQNLFAALLVSLFNNRSQQTVDANQQLLAILNAAQTSVLLTTAQQAYVGGMITTISIEIGINNALRLSTYEQRVNGLLDVMLAYRNATSVAASIQTLFFNALQTVYVQRNGEYQTPSAQSNDAFDSLSLLLLYCENTTLLNKQQAAICNTYGSISIIEQPIFDALQDTSFIDKLESANRIVKSAQGEPVDAITNALFFRLLQQIYNANSSYFANNPGDTTARQLLQQTLMISSSSPLLNFNDQQTVRQWLGLMGLTVGATSTLSNNITTQLGNLGSSATATQTTLNGLLKISQQAGKSPSANDKTTYWSAIQQVLGQLSTAQNQTPPDTATIKNIQSFLNNVKNSPLLPANSQQYIANTILPSLSGGNSSGTSPSTNKKPANPSTTTQQAGKKKNANSQIGQVNTDNTGGGATASSSNASGGSSVQSSKKPAVTPPAEKTQLGLAQKLIDKAQSGKPLTAAEKQQLTEAIADLGNNAKQLSPADKTKLKNLIDQASSDPKVGLTSEQKNKVAKGKKQVTDAQTSDAGAGSSSGSGGSGSKKPSGGGSGSNAGGDNTSGGSSGAGSTKTSPANTKKIKELQDLIDKAKNGKSLTPAEKDQLTEAIADLGNNAKQLSPADKTKLKNLIDQASSNPKVGLTSAQKNKVATGKKQVTDAQTSDAGAGSSSGSGGSGSKKPSGGGSGSNAGGDNTSGGSSGAGSTKTSPANAKKIKELQDLIDKAKNGKSLTPGEKQQLTDAIADLGDNAEQLSPGDKTKLKNLIDQASSNPKVGLTSAQKNKVAKGKKQVTDAQSSDAGANSSGSGSNKKTGSSSKSAAETAPAQKQQVEQLKKLIDRAKDGTKLTPAETQQVADLIASLGDNTDQLSSDDQAAVANLIADATSSPNVPLTSEQKNKVTKAQAQVDDAQSSESESTASGNTGGESSGAGSTKTSPANTKKIKEIQDLIDKAKNGKSLTPGEKQQLTDAIADLGDNAEQLSPGDKTKLKNLIDQASSNPKVGLTSAQKNKVAKGKKQVTDAQSSDAGANSSGSGSNKKTGSSSKSAAETAPAQKQQVEQLKKLIDRAKDGTKLTPAETQQVADLIASLGDNTDQLSSDDQAAVANLIADATSSPNVPLTSEQKNKVTKAQTQVDDAQSSDIGSGSGSSNKKKTGGSSKSVAETAPAQKQQVEQLKKLIAKAKDGIKLTPAETQQVADLIASLGDNTDQLSSDDQAAVANLIADATSSPNVPLTSEQKNKVTKAQAQVDDAQSSESESTASGNTGGESSGAGSTKTSPANTKKIKELQDLIDKAKNGKSLTPAEKDQLTEAIADLGDNAEQLSPADKTKLKNLIDQASSNPKVGLTSAQKNKVAKGKKQVTDAQSSDAGANSSGSGSNKKTGGSSKSAAETAPAQKQQVEQLKKLIAKAKGGTKLTPAEAQQVTDLITSLGDNTDQLSSDDQAAVANLIADATSSQNVPLTAEQKNKVTKAQTQVDDAQNNSSGSSSGTATSPVTAADVARVAAITDPAKRAQALNELVKKAGTQNLSPEVKTALAAVINDTVNKKLPSDPASLEIVANIVKNAEQAGVITQATATTLQATVAPAQQAAAKPTAQNVATIQAMTDVQQKMDALDILITQAGKGSTVDSETQAALTQAIQQLISQSSTMTSAQKQQLTQLLGLVQKTPAAGQAVVTLATNATGKSAQAINLGGTLQGSVSSNINKIAQNGSPLMRTAMLQNILARASIAKLTPSDIAAARNAIKALGASLYAQDSASLIAYTATLQQALALGIITQSEYDKFLALMKQGTPPPAPQIALATSMSLTDIQAYGVKVYGATQAAAAAKNTDLAVSFQSKFGALNATTDINQKIVLIKNLGPWAEFKTFAATQQMSAIQAIQGVITTVKKQYPLSLPAMKQSLEGFKKTTLLPPQAAQSFAAQLQ